MTENVATKARRYLGEGRLTVLAVEGTGVRATCRGDGAVYEVSWSPADGWSCSCPARRDCAHLTALRLVVVAI